MLRIVPPPSRHSEVLELLQSVKGPTQANSGCLSYRVYKEADPERSVLLIEEWESEPAFVEQVRSELFRRVLEAIELSSQPPELAIRRVSVSNGFELIQQLRGSGDPALAERTNPIVL